MAHELRTKGYTSMIVCVLTDNPSKSAYEKLGAQYVDSKYITIGDKNYKEDILVWGNLPTS